MKRLSIVLATMLALPANAQVGASMPEGPLVPLHQAMYEVMTGDPSCNGPYQRLIRTQVVIDDLMAASQPVKMCGVRERKGTKTWVNQYPCDERAAPSQALENGTRAVDRVSLKATVDTCQGLWDIRTELTSGAVEGVFGGKAFSLPLQDEKFGSINLNGWVTSPEQTRFAFLALQLECDISAVVPNAAMLRLQAYFQMREGAAGECSDGNCPTTAEAADIRSKPGPRLRLLCAESEGVAIE